MIFAKTITSPYGKSSIQTTDTILQLTHGLIYQVDFYLPQGSQGLLNFKVLDYNSQLYPFNLDEWFFGDTISISFPETHMIDVPPYQLIVRHYNEDSQYDHRFQIRIGLASTESAIARYLPTVAAEEMVKAITQLKESEAKAQAEQLQTRIAEQTTFLERIPKNALE